MELNMYIVLIELMETLEILEIYSRFDEYLAI